MKTYLCQECDLKDIMTKILPCKLLKQVKTLVKNGLRFAVMISLVPSKGQYMKVVT